MTVTTDRERLVLSLLLTAVHDQIGTFYDLSDLERPFIIAEDIEAALDNLAEKGLVSPTSSTVSSVDQPLNSDPYYELTPRGLAHCLANEAAVLRAAMSGSTEHLVEVRNAFDRIRDAQGISVDSANWTGLTQKLGPAKLAEFRKASRDLIEVVQQSDLAGDSRENALAIARAVSVLAEAPDPAWKQIFELLTSQPLTAFLNVAALISIIVNVVT